MRAPLLARPKRLKPILGQRNAVQHDLIAKFLEHVASSPEKIALMTTEISWTYQDLYLDVLRWKTILQQHIEHRTIVCLHRSPRLVSVLLALQWLNITYIPVDPAIPLERLNTIIEDSQATSVLYDHTDHLVVSCQALNLTQLEQSPLAFKDIADTPLPQKETTAYIIYTSGSTGKPKGVAISRLALNNFLASMGCRFLQHEQDTLLAITTIAFDIAALELYLPLWNKKTLFIANQDQHKDPLSLVKILANYPISLVQTTPSFWKMLLAVNWPGHSDLVALCGGEPLTSSLAQQLLTQVSELWNMYGPTEATVWCALKQIHANEPITIGRPIENMEMRVMNAAHQILPPYVKGELFIAGVGLATEYVNNNALTQNKFIPCKEALYGRLYHAGDLACTTEEGEFIIFGRTDNQIKLHGYRIELEEIEAQIQAFPGISACAVTVYQEQLIAYLCLSDPATFSESTLQTHLAQHLPEYMIPKRIMLLKKLPISLSGKIDRKALPAPVALPSTPSIESSELTSMQLSLINLWAKELKLPSIGLHDNFFELGGHSLIAVRIIAVIASQFSKQTSLHDFYHAPTVQQFATIVEQAQSSASFEPEEEVAPLSTTRWLPLNDFQFLLWISTIFEPQLKKFNVAARKRLQGPLNKTALDSALQLVFQKHEILSYTINRFFPAQNPHATWLLQWAEKSLIDQDEASCEAYLTQSINELFYRHQWRTDGPMIIAKLYYLTQDRIELQIGMPHLISDDESLAIFFQDLSNAYLFYAHHQTLEAKESLHPYQHYVLKQQITMNKYAHDDASFWKNYLQDAGLFYFPDKYIFGPAVATHIPIPEAVLLKLKQFCMQHHATPHDVLSAAIALSLKICLKDELSLPHKLVINTVKSTRDHPRYDNVIGCFLRITPMKLDLSNDPTLIDITRQIQQSTAETRDYQRAASIVKLASIGKIPYLKRSVKTMLCAVISLLLTKLCTRVTLNQSLLKACITLASIDRKNNFLINMNILNNFFTDPAAKPQQPICGAPHQDIPIHPYPINLINSVFDVCFHRSNDQHLPFLVISSNITPSFQERFGQTLLSFFHS